MFVFHVCGPISEKLYFCIFISINNESLEARCMGDATYWGVPRQQLRPSAVGHGKSLEGFKLKLHICIWIDGLAALQKVGLHLLTGDPCLLSSTCFHLSIMSSKAAGRLVNTTNYVKHKPCRSHRESGQGTNWTRRHEVSISPPNQPSKGRDTPLVATAPAPRWDMQVVEGLGERLGRWCGCGHHTWSSLKMSTSHYCHCVHRV